tara:strand:+ start:42 stop:806 length:765 start_codon:yes stop_codon:yes gene_type:complete
MNQEVQNFINTLRENNPGKYDTYTDQELIDNFSAIVGPYGFDDSFNIDQVNLGSDYFTDKIGEDSEFVNPFFKGFQKVKSTMGDFTAPAIGGLMSLATGIPGLGFILGGLSKFRQPNVPNPMAQGVYKDPNTGFLKDKFGYNVGPTLFKSNFLQPGSSSYRSYALQGLGGLNKNLANNFYQTHYGKSFNEVKRNIQKKQNPFGPQDPNIGTSDYQGGGGGGGFDTSKPGGEGAFGSYDGSRGRKDYIKGGIASL